MNERPEDRSPDATEEHTRRSGNFVSYPLDGRAAEVDFTIADDIAADPSGRAAIRHRLLTLARDVGILRRRFASNEGAWTGAYIAERLADHIETLDVMVNLSAGELVACSAPGDDDAVEEALRIVEERERVLRAKLARKTT